MYIASVIVHRYIENESVFCILEKDFLFLKRAMLLCSCAAIFPTLVLQLKVVGLAPDFMIMLHMVRLVTLEK
jgi:hypothetical protein